MSKKDTREQRLARQSGAAAVVPQGGYTVKATATQFTGPIPPPVIMAEYEKTLPGSAERILTMAERQARHREALEARIVDSNCRAQTRGQWLGFFVALPIVVGGVGLVAMGRSLEGLSMVLTSLGGLVGIFIVGRWRQERERREKLTAFAPPR